MINRGKPRNKVVCAIGHKLVLYAFHIMRGDPTPNRDGEAFFRRKMVGLHSEIGAAPEPATPGGATPSEAKSN